MTNFLIYVILPCAISALLVQLFEKDSQEIERKKRDELEKEQAELERERDIKRYEYDEIKKWATLEVENEQKTLFQRIKKSLRK
jgi:hypothetical protein